MHSALLLTIINSKGCDRGVPHPLLPMGAEAPSSTPLDPPMGSGIQAVAGMPVCHAIDILLGVKWGVLHGIQQHIHDKLNEHMEGTLCMVTATSIHFI